jgi:hypothetical protein
VSILLLTFTLRGSIGTDVQAEDPLRGASPSALDGGSCQASGPFLVVGSQPEHHHDSDYDSSDDERDSDDHVEDHDFHPRNLRFCVFRGRRPPDAPQV